MKTYCGVDLGVKSSAFCFIDEQGHVVDEGEVTMDKQCLKRIFGSTEPDTTPIGVFQHSQSPGCPAQRPVLRVRQMSTSAAIEHTPALGHPSEKGNESLGHFSVVHPDKVSR